MNAFLIVSESFNLIQEEINKIVNDNNFVNINLNYHSIDDLFYEANLYSLDGSKKYIVVKNAPYFTSKTDDVDKINTLLNNSHSILIFTANNIDQRLKLTKTFKDNDKIINLSIDYKNVYNIINNYIKENNFNVDYDTTKYLVSLYGLNLDIIIQEIKKMFLYFASSKTINYKDAQNIISTPLNNNVYKFLDSILDKDISNSLKLLNDLIVYKIDESMLTILLAREYRLILNILYLQKNNETKYNIMSKLKLLDWQLEKLYKKSVKYTTSELESLIHQLAILDYKIKSGKIDKLIAIKTFLINALT